MATKAATETVAKARAPFQVGKTQVYLPNHVIKMLPPRKILSPYFATFQVPLRFNKLDLRDYLYHAYGVEVRAVRSWLTAQMPRRRFTDPDSVIADPATGKIDAHAVREGGRGPWFRPQPIKRMMVELVKPFAFPEPPAKPDESKILHMTMGEENPDDPRSAWDYALHRRHKRQQDDTMAMQRDMHKDNKFALHIEEKHVPAFRVQLAKQARELVSGGRAWRPEGQVDADRWAALAAADKAKAAVESKTQKSYRA